MSNLILKTRNLSKNYYLGTYNHIKFLQILNQILFNKKNESDKIIALNNINISVEKGESIAILGKNGFGKTTLCKLISEVTEPSSGLIELYGKVVPILALTFGVQLETTGSENIKFLGSMFGVDKNYVEKNMKKIAEFANISEFIETPLKKYSSGMITRLIFSTLINFPCDLFLLDEVLAVSDQSFKNRAIRELIKKNNDGTSIICISHEENIIRSLCKYAYVFTEKGILSEKLEINEAYELYESTIKK